MEEIGRPRSVRSARFSPAMALKSGSDDIENFSLQKLSKEWKERALLFFFPRDMCNNKGERQ